MGGAGEPQGHGSSAISGGSRVVAFDGLRGVCIVAVTLLHAGFGDVITGRIGVYVFFTLSGFLITSLLLEEQASSGRVSLPAFYERRARRLLPALAVLLVVVVLYGQLWDSRLLPGPAAVASIVFYVANWLLIARGAGALDPLDHLWSLSVEEQFYLVWPVVVLLVGARGRRPSRLLFVCAAGTAGAFVARTLILSQSAPNIERLLTGTDTNADHLLLGCALAVILKAASETQRARLSTFLSRVVLPALVYFVYVLFVDAHVLTDRGHAAWWFPAQQTAIAIASAILIGSLFLDRESTAFRVLSRRPLVRLGEISYGWYLWHVPILVLLRLHMEPYNRFAGLALAVALTYPISRLSYRFIELPIRRRASRNVALSPA